jgi:ribosomal protein L37AE/L43A
MPYADPIKARQCRARIQRRNRDYIARRRAESCCSNCGRQPVDFHNEAHAGDHKRRIGAMTGHTVSLATIEAEIQRSTPLCRRCHMRLDGRIHNLRHP